MHAPPPTSLARALSSPAHHVRPSHAARPRDVSALPTHTLRVHRIRAAGGAALALAAGAPDTPQIPRHTRRSAHSDLFGPVCHAARVPWIRLVELPVAPTPVLELKGTGLLHRDRLGVVPSVNGEHEYGAAGAARGHDPHAVRKPAHKEVGSGGDRTVGVQITALLGPLPTPLDIHPAELGLNPPRWTDIPCPTSYILRTTPHSPLPTPRARPAPRAPSHRGPSLRLNRARLCTRPTQRATYSTPTARLSSLKTRVGRVGDHAEA